MDLFFITLSLGVVGVLAFVWYLYRALYIYLADGSRVRRSTLLNAAASPEIPFQGSIPAMAWVVNATAVVRLLPTPVSAYLVKWGLAGDITFWRREQEGKAKKKKEICAVRLTQLPHQADGPEAFLFEMFQQAAIMGEAVSDTEFFKWSGENVDQVEVFNRDIRAFGAAQLVERQFAAADAKGKIRLTRRGVEEVRALLGLLRYLQEIEKQDVTAARHLWGEHLIVASLFGKQTLVTRRLWNADSAVFTDLAPDGDGDLFLHFMKFCRKWSTDPAEPGDRSRVLGIPIGRS